MPVSPRASRIHRDALTRLLRSTGIHNVPEFAPLVALAKDQARVMDVEGGTRTAATYLSILKDINRALDGRRPIGGTAESTSRKSAAKATEEPAADEGLPEPTSLANFKQQRGIK